MGNSKTERTKRNRKRRKARTGGGGVFDRGVEPIGDIPRTVKRTYSTISCPRPRAGGNYIFRQIIDGAQIQANPTGFGFAYSWKVSQLDGISSMGSLFDQYRILAVDFHIVPDQNALQVATLSTNQWVPLYCVIDYDDSTVPTSAAYTRQYNNCIELQPGESLQRRFQPRAEAAVIDSTSTTVNALSIGDTWMDIAQTNVPFRGIKIWSPSTVAGQTSLQSWSVFTEVFVELRAVR